MGTSTVEHLQKTIDLFLTLAPVQLSAEGDAIDEPPAPAEQPIPVLPSVLHTATAVMIAAQKEIEARGSVDE